MGDTNTPVSLLNIMPCVLVSPPCLEADASVRWERTSQDWLTCVTSCRKQKASRRRKAIEAWLGVHTALPDPLECLQLSTRFDLGLILNTCASASGQHSAVALSQVLHTVLLTAPCSLQCAARGLGYHVAGHHVAGMAGVPVLKRTMSRFCCHSP
jgi:hypothetical protein